MIIVGDQCPRDTPVTKLDLPADPAHPDPAGYLAERQELQRAYIARLLATAGGRAVGTTAAVAGAAHRSRNQGGERPD